MKLYMVSFWTEGPGRSHTEKAIVVANNKKQAVKFIIKACGVYKADQSAVTAKRIKDMPLVIGYADDPRLTKLTT